MAPRPKRPAPSYVMWMNVQGRQRIKMEHPNCSVPQMGKRGGEIWREMDEKEKDNWRSQACLAMINYKKKLDMCKCRKNIKRR